jgi:quercetin dioxygenase-like cupin family protein
VEADNVQLTVVAPIGFIQQNLFVNMVEAKQGRFVESHTDDGYSFIYILEGTIVLEHDSAEYKLEQGDSFYFDASYPHSVTATSAYHKAITIFFKGKK